MREKKREEKGKNEKFARESDEGRGKKQRNKIDERMKIMKNSIHAETDDGLINEYDKGDKKGDSRKSERERTRKGRN